MSHKSFSGGSSVYSDDSHSSTWTTTYTKLPRKQPKTIRFLSWVAGAPAGATAVKKRTRDFPDDRSVRSGGSSFSYWNGPETQLYWVAHSHGDYYSGSSGSSTGSRRSKKSSSSRKNGGSRNHFEGAVPRPPMVQPMGMPMPPMPMPMNAGPPPPPMGPPMDGGFGGGYEGGYDDGVYDGGYDPGMGGGYSPGPMHGHPPPMPPPPMNPQMSEPAPFINVTGQNQPGNPFHGGRGGPPQSESDWSSEGE
ncbi:hypothetical protein HG530_009811 [Fusarium avenaceum]|uniref:Uncharacterized protein n=1 Tax=Fusarium avenaceum TaxID=40199 RepID=A0A9P7KY74_9HYPO|nr:hypothetical protein KAF25_001132 [Fusarium avenaceum]KAH6958967.1 hypothetical protein DER45DRAFT_245975 [Fusarium avenaceum]KAI6760951.1 hypothetical protein HG530_009811 [Fusarium avenaceum]KIL93369.1 hypothetical protein FAVG1_03349 [Fusarium avenaceum]